MKKLIISGIVALTFAISTSTFAEGYEFSDVTKSHPFYDHIHYLNSENIINGYDTGDFKPDLDLTRGQAALMLARAFDLDLAPRETVFKDVNKNLSGAVQSAFEAKIINGTSATSFAPDAKITREQMAMLLARAFKLEEQSAKEFSDVGMQTTAYTSIRKIHAFGLTGGVDENHFDPTGYVSRQAFSAFLARGLNEDLRLNSSSCGYDEDSRINPSRQTLNCIITNAARKADGIIPPEIVKGIANVENGKWEHYKANGQPIISSDGGIGLMQITSLQDYDVEKLKYNIEYNIEVAIDMLLYHFNRSDLPKIGTHDPNQLESWYFAVMAYNGTKSVNSPFYKATGASNPTAYQEKVFSAINTSSQLATNIPAIQMSSKDFTYDSASSENIIFNQLKFTMNSDGTLTKDRFKTGDQLKMANIRLREKPSTDALRVEVPVGTPVKIVGGPVYDLLPTSKNNFIWYPVEIMINGKKDYLYVPSQSIE
ncbi:MAG: S-layer homology domain-containing protein [Firmicutes bacterium]|nr:S-layer homology domain-containing protein [Bacillota bacterium]